MVVVVATDGLRLPSPSPVCHRLQFLVRRCSHRPAAMYVARGILPQLTQLTVILSPRPALNKTHDKHIPITRTDK